MLSRDPATLLAEARAGNRLAAGRLLSLVERGGTQGAVVARLTGPAAADLVAVIGLTGAPGAGKSTLTDHLIGEARRDGSAVGVLAVDPSSPFSGGAILGDRVRMADHSTDPGVFIRSMATRGHYGGLSLAVPEAIRVLAAVGYPKVLVETVGVGQVEVEIAGEADTTVVVVNPGWGDGVQVAKAGLLEVADVFVINKADRPGVEGTRRDLDAMLDLDPSMGTWRPPILACTASAGEGTTEVWAAIEAHGRYLRSSGELEGRRRRRLLRELDAILVRRLSGDVRTLGHEARYAEVAAEVVAHRLDPASAATELLGALRFRQSGR